MAVLGSLNLAFTATTDKFSKGVSTIERGLASVRAAVAATKAALVGGLALVGIGLGTAAITNFTAKQMEAIDANAKLSDRIGVTTRMLAGMQLNADLAGVSVEEMGTNIERMLKNIGNASPEFEKTLKMLGTSSDELKAVSADEALNRIADGFAKIRNPAMQAAIVTDIFGKAGARMNNVLKEGREGLAKAAEEAKLFGVVMSRDKMAGVEKALDNWTRIKTIFSGFGQQLAGEFAPILSNITDKVILVVKAFGGVEPIMMRVQAAFFSFGATAMEVFSEVLKATNRLIDSINEIANNKLIKVALFGPGMLLAPDIRIPKIGGIADIDAAGRNLRRKAELKEQEAMNFGKNNGPNLAAQGIDRIKEFANRGIFFAGNLLDFLNKGLENVAKEADKVRESVKTPLMVFRDEIGKLSALKAFGPNRGGIGKDTFNLAAMEAFKKLGNVIGGTAFKGAGALEFGSGDATNELNRSQTEAQMTFDEILGEAKRQTELQKKMADALGKQIEVAVAQIN